MAEFIPLHLASGDVTTSFATIYTVPVGKTLILNSIVFVNTTSSLVEVQGYVKIGAITVHVTPAPIKLPAGSMFDNALSVAVNAGGEVIVLASATGVTYIASGVITQ